MTAAYVFDATVRVSAAEVSLSPDRFETTLRLFAPEPGESGAQIDWLFFRDRLWSGEISDEAPLRRAASDWLDVAVESLSFKELRTDEAYLEALREAIAEDLTRFNAESVDESRRLSSANQKSSISGDADEALQQYLGSSIHIVSREEV